MKNPVLFIALLFIVWQAVAQVSISTENSSPDPSAMLDVNSITRGLLPPRMTTAQRNSIASPAQGLTIFNTDLNCLEFFQSGTNSWYCPCPGNFKVGCNSEQISGSYSAGTALNSANTVTMSVMVNTPGGYTIQTKTANGCTFSASGVFTATGYQTVILKGSGTPLTGGTFPYLLLISNNETTCSFSITYQSQTGNGTEQAYFPFTTYWMDSKTQLLYTAGELQVSGANSGTITAIGFDVTGTISPQVMNGFQISMKNTSNALLNGLLETGLTTVYSGTYAVTGSGWQMITLQTPFSWDGRNLLIQICFDNNSFSSSSMVYASPVTDKAQASREDLTSASGCNLDWTSLEGLRPNLKMNFAAQLPGCGQLVVDHFAGSVAPVNKSVTYSTVTNIPGEPSKCWITKNLGATQQAASLSDHTEASAGWYWQFNRKQGYKHDGTTRTPNTTWITSINENSDWQTANDPCNLELGTQWRLPTSTEWSNVDNTGGWTDWYGPWNSGLKLHPAGNLSNSNGALLNPSFGYYWSSSQSSTEIGNALYFNSGNSGMNNNFKALGCSVRCLRDN